MRRSLLLVLVAMAAAPIAVRAQDPPPLFTDLVVVGADPLAFGDAAWGDLDGDGDLDLVLSGGAGTARTPTLRFLLRTGDISVERPDPFGGEPILVPAVQYASAVVSAPAPTPLWKSRIALLDYDGDSDLDVAVTGAPATGAPRLIVIENRGTTGFLQRWSFDGVSDGDLEAADLDGDGDTDLALAGDGADGSPVALVYENRNRSGEGFVARSHSIEGASLGSLAAADFDLDGDTDLLLTGHSATGAPVASLYRNDGADFAAIPIPMPALYFPSAEWGDIDADGDPDLVATGARLGPMLYHGVNTILENRGGSFVERADWLRGRFPEEDVPGRYRGSPAFGDIDSDGLLDLTLTGSMGKIRNEPGGYYLSAGSVGWNLIPRDRIDGGLSGRTVLGDYDNDSDLDVMAVGESSAAGFVLRIQRNTAPRPDIGISRRNRRAAAPSSLGEVVSGSEVSLSWAAGSDPDTPTPGLTYEVRLGTTEGGGQVVAARSDASGRRLLPTPGNAGSLRSMRVRDLAPGTYWWSVQTVDAAHAGSAFASTRTFTIR